jgi:3',5'-cyclic AMP phosphodiesterase CpdA
MGRRGDSEQQNIANLMGRFVEQNKIDFMAVVGDPIHDDGVMSVSDEEWKLKIENVYSAKSLQKLPFYVVSGNHEYHGSVRAILDYSQKSERWNAPARYFSMEYPIGKKQKALLVFIDTAPLIEKYRNNSQYSDAGEQDMERQLYWLDSTLVASKGRWKIVIGHHPIYADTDKEESERTDMQERVEKILESRKADFYISGHIHNFQYIKPEGKTVNYIVNSSASQSRPIHSGLVEGTLFANPDPGFSVFTVSRDSVRFCFVNHTGETVYKQAIGK